MQREQKRPTIRFVRSQDGSLRPADTANKSEDALKELWGKQKATLEITPPSFKDDFKSMVSTVKNKAKNKSPQPSAKAKSTPTTNNRSQNTHTIALTIPAVKIPKLPNVSKIPKVYLIAGLVVVVIAGAVWLLWPNGSNNSNQAANSGQVAGAIQYNIKPNYAVMSPSGAGVDNLGGFALISPAGEPKVYAYTDTINGVPIKVSQQELPDSIGQDGQKLRDLASQFNATEQLEVDDRSAYVGTSVNGPQSVIFVRENILVLIASDSEISNKQWVEYLGELRF